MSGNIEIGEVFKGKVKSASIEATKITADGRRIPLGVVSYYHRNPLRRWWWSFKQLVKPLGIWWQSIRRKVQ